MIIKFSVANFLSFKELAVLNMQPETIREMADENIAAPNENIEILKSAVLYGANSSGKSNLLKALQFAKKFILSSSKDKQAHEKIEVESFKLSDETENSPSFFEIEFFHQEIKYRYNFKVDEDRVHEEALFFTKKNKEYMYFKRTIDTLEIEGKFIEEAEGLEKMVRNNALLLSVVAQFNGAISSSIIEWVQNIKILSDIKQDFNFTASLMGDGAKLNYPITKLLAAGDLGFEKIKSEKIAVDESMLKNVPKEMKDFILSQKIDQIHITTLHKKYDKNKNQIGEVYLNLAKHESLGTQKYFALAGHIVDALAHGVILIIDELDSRLHPLLSAALVKLFNSKVNNRNFSQLIFATHNTTLLNKKIFRRDQVWLTKKDGTGATKLNTLLSENVRNDVSFEKNYLLGEYNAIPIIDINLQLFDNSPSN